MATSKIEFSRVRDLIDTKDSKFSFTKFLEGSLDNDLDLYVVVEYDPRTPEWMVVSKKIIQLTVIKGLKSLYCEEVDRHDESLDPEAWAIMKANIDELWVKKSDEKQLKSGLKKSDYKATSDETLIRTYEAIIQALAEDIQNSAISPLLRLLNDKQVLTASKLSAHIRENSSRYFKNVSDGDMPYGYNDRSIENAFSKAMKSST